MPGKRRMLWICLHSACSRPNLQTETVESAENMMTVNKKFIKILKSSFKAMNGDYENKTSEEKNLNAIEIKMDRLFREVIDSKNSKFDDCVTLALSYLYMSYIYIDNEDNTLITKKYLTKSLELLKGKELDSKAILIAMRTHNELSYVEMVKKNITEAELHLHEALQLYNMFTKEKDDYPIPIDVANILDIEDKASCKCLLEGIYKVTLEGLLNLDNIISLRLKHTDIPKAAIYMHKLLYKQLNAADTDYITWAMQSAELSTYFAKYGRFTEARNHLAAANFMIQQYFLHIYHKTEESNTVIIENISKITYKHASCMITKYWAKYGLTLLSLSKERIIRDAKDKFCEASNSQSSESVCSVKSERQPKDLLIFSTIEEDLKEFTAPITDKCPLDYKEAKEVFVSILKWYNDAKKYLTAITSLTTYDKLINEWSIATGVSMAYRYLAYYEQDKSNKIKLHKRRIDVIKKVIEISDPISDPIEREIYKRLYLELISSYTTIVDMMTEHLRADKSELSEEELLEVKQLVTHCLTSLKSYLNFSTLST